MAVLEPAFETLLDIFIKKDAGVVTVEATVFKMEGIAVDGVTAGSLLPICAGSSELIINPMRLRNPFVTGPVAPTGTGAVIMPTMAGALFPLEASTFTPRMMQVGFQSRMFKL
jgi:hypothetical protein